MNKSLILVTCIAVCAAFAGPCRAQSDAPYTEGPVWTITMVKAKPGMTDDYLKTQTKNFKAFSWFYRSHERQMTLAELREQKTKH